jgi:hypothetical protein
MLRDFGDLLDHSWYHSPDLHVSSIADSLRVRIIQPQVRSLTRTLASRETKSYLPLNRGGTRTTWIRTGCSLGLFIQPANPLVILKKWPHHLPLLCLSTKRDNKEFAHLDGAKKYFPMIAVNERGAFYGPPPRAILPSVLWPLEVTSIFNGCL